MSDDNSRTVELHLRAAVESSPSGLLMVDPDGRIVLVNREVERLFGYSREELLGQSVDLLVPESMREGHGAFRDMFLSDPKVRSMGVGRDLYGLRRDGTQVPVEIGLTPVATERGMFVLSSIVDISSRKSAEARFRAAVESSPAGMVMVDQKGRIVLVNREVERLFGYDRTELVGTSIERLVPERFRDRHPGFREGFFNAPDVRAMGAGRDLFGLCKDGTEVPIEIGLNPIEMEEGLFVLSSIVDISERQREEREGKELEAHLRQAHKLEAVGTLAGGVAHDFNNILGAILGYAELLEDQIRDPDALRDLDELKQFVGRGRSLVQRIQAFGRRQEARRVPLALARPLDEVTRFLRSSLGPGIQIESRAAPDTPRILGDPSAMHQVIMNLGMNAAQAMGRGGRLSLEVEGLYVTDSRARRHPELREGPHAVLSVRDTGAGIPPEVRERVFEPFFTTKPAGSGTGLGLAIVHGIVREHDGAIELESEVDVGTTVRVFLPAVDLEEPEPEPKFGVARGRGERVLYVEDEPGVAAVGRRGLERLGYEVTAATDGQAALELLRADPDAFDIVVTDYLMPRMNGLELTEAIAALRPGLPVVLLTGYVDNLPNEEILARGVREVLSKPASIHELSTRLRALLDGGSAG
jgi:PAS domain S-box-containing protein